MVDEPITVLFYLVFDGDDIFSVLVVNFNGIGSGDTEMGF